MARQASFRMLLWLFFNGLANSFHFRNSLQPTLSRLKESRANDSEEKINEILQVAIEASKAAGSIIKENANGSSVVEKKSTSRDLLTLIDPQCEAAIRQTITEKFPDHGFLGEEEVAPGIDAAIAALEEKLSVPGWLWIVDPVRTNKIEANV
jgi:hypothetical protein